MDATSNTSPDNIVKCEHRSRPLQVSPTVTTSSFGMTTYLAGRFVDSTRGRPIVSV